MKTLERPLIVITTLIIVSLLLSWKYLDDYDTTPSTSTQFNYNQLTDADMLTQMADNTSEQEEDGRPSAAKDVLVQRISRDNNHLLLMAYYSKENYSNKSFTIENGYTITFKDDGKEDDTVARDGLCTAKIPAGREAGLCGFISGRAGRGGAVDFDHDTTNNLMAVKDAALRPSTNPAIRTFNDIEARAKGLKGFLSTAYGTALAISSQLMFQPTTTVH